VREPLQLACPSTSQRDHRAEPTEQCASEQRVLPPATAPPQLSLSM
jgi:hypothetical protein